MVAILSIGGMTGNDDNPIDHFDVPVSDIAKYNVGDEITVTIKGCIGMVAIPPDPGIGNPKIGIKVYSQEIKKTGNLQVEELQKLVDGEDDENAEGDYTGMDD